MAKLSITDALTGLYNRNKIDSSMAIELSRSKRYYHNFSIILIDIDDFKQFNDKHGHQMGDKVLVEVSKMLKNGIRDTDILGRWGGEEFIIICPETNLQNAVNLADYIRLLIVNCKFQSTTASFGVSSYEKRGLGRESLQKSG